MSNINNRPPKGEAWFWMTRELLLSAAWRELGINGRRFVEFLITDHLAHAGQNNGKIKAPHRDLAQIGVARRFAADAIREAEEHGLVDCIRGGMRVATSYALTWLPLSDGTPASNRWRTYSAKKEAPVQRQRNRNLPHKGEPALAYKSEPDSPIPEDYKGEPLLREALTKGGDVTTEPEVGAAQPARLPWSTPTLTELHGKPKAEVLAWAAGKLGDEPELPAFLDRRPAAARAAAALQTVPQ
jgi:hypothetical protein